MRRQLALGMGLGIWVAAATANAAQPFTEQSASLSGHLGFGANLDDGPYDLNPYGFGFGARGGYTFRPNIYLGGLFDFFVGNSDTTSAGVLGVGASDKQSANGWILQIEGGYDIGVTRAIVIRPKLGLGATTINSKECLSGTLVSTTCDKNTDGGFTLGLGAEALFNLDPIYIAPELRFNVGDTVSAMIMMVGVGAAF